MRRFTELLLLVTCILTPLFFVNGFQALQPTTKNNPLRRDAMIRGLLAPRGFFCPSGFICETDFCCHENWHCCKNGGCCDPSSYCSLASNGVIGCCPNGKICSGPVGGPQTVNPPPPPPPPTNTQPAPIFTSTSSSTFEFTSTSEFISTPEFTSTSDFISTPEFASTSTSTATLTGILGDPSGSPTPTDFGPAFSAAGRVQPYRLLLVPGSILLAAVVSIICFSYF